MGFEECPNPMPETSSIARIFLYYSVLKAIRMTPIYGLFLNVCQGEKGHVGFALIFEPIANILLG